MTLGPAGAGAPAMPLRAALVDLDGTLVDTLGDFEAALASTLAELGFAPLARDFVGRAIGKGSAHLVRRALAEAGAAEEHLEAAVVRYQHHYTRVNGRHSSVYAGAVEGLQALRDLGIELACVTNKPAAHARALLEAKGLARFFATISGGDTFARGKPDPLPLLGTCRRLGVAPQKALVIGDSGNDAAAARAAGCPVVLLRHGYNHGRPLEAEGADALFDRLDEIAGWLPRAGYCCGPG